MTVRTMAMAQAIAGTLGFPSKMPGTSYGIPAQACGVGGKLREIKGSTCENCYAYERGNYGFKSTQLSQQTRLDSLQREQWIEAMVFMLRHHHGLDGGKVHFKMKDALWHRWHDSGDLQSLDHLNAIIAVCEGTPEIQHWLPTREVGILRAWEKANGRAIDAAAPNLCVRVSATMVDGAASSHFANTSRVRGKASEAGADDCPARHQGNECGACRKCWDRGNPNTTYPIH